MLAKLAECENKYEEIEHLLTDPEVLADPVRYRQAVTEHAALQETVETYRQYKKAAAERDEARAILDSASGDRELKELAQEQLVASKEKLKTLTEKLKMLLSPKDPRDSGDVAVEIRAGAGGEEAALFAAVLFRMYSKYAEGRGWTVSVMDASETELGGFKEIVFTIEGRGAYGRLKYESGVHRVQRVPQTESGGRIHTSTATVAVFPESDDSDSFELDMNDVASATDYTAVTAAPTFVEPGYTGYVTIGQVDVGACVRITDRDGNIVREFTATSNQVAWDTCDETGERVPTGVYSIYAGLSADQLPGTPQVRVKIIK